jgi:hypothetical protein
MARIEEAPISASRLEIDCRHSLDILWIEVYDCQGLVKLFHLPTLQRSICRQRVLLGVTIPLEKSMLLSGAESASHSFRVPHSQFSQFFDNILN